MIRALALAAALAFPTAAGLSTLSFSRQPSAEAQVNARLDAQLHRTLHRLALQAAHPAIASAGDYRGTRLGLGDRR